MVQIEDKFFLLKTELLVHVIQCMCLGNPALNNICFAIVVVFIVLEF